ncbi:MAG TPA: hypothetical protein VE398_24295 [Acidobacteriota bacterium]|nr:hypothetical protein [Acidobacteriota bacterium]
MVTVVFVMDLPHPMVELYYLAISKSCPLARKMSLNIIRVAGANVIDNSFSLARTGNTCLRVWSNEESSFVNLTNRNGPEIQWLVATAAGNLWNDHLYARVRLQGQRIDDPERVRRVAVENSSA